MDTKFTAVIGVIILGVIIAGLAIWYMSTHPAPVTPLGQIATSTPTGPGTQHIVKSGKYYDIDLQYPGSTILAQNAGTQADTNAVAVMKGFLQNQADTFVSENKLESLTPSDVSGIGLDQGRKYDLEATYESKQSPKTVSYIYTIFADTLGAHPNTYFHTFTFNLATGANMSIGDLFQPSVNYAATLSQISRAKLPAMIADMESVPVDQVDQSMLLDGTTPDPKNFENWYLDGTDLVIVFPPYQVGPYVLGAVSLSIPTSSLHGSLKPDFGG